MNDADFGIVFVACGNDNDCIIIGKDEQYTLYCGNKKSIAKVHEGDFDECIRNGIAAVGDLKPDDTPITKMQIKLLAPEYPTTALTKHGANCCICWKTWKSAVKGD